MVLTYLRAMSAQPSFLEFVGPVYSKRKVSFETFEAFALANPDLVMELEADGTVKIMSPVAPISGNRENQISADLVFYERKSGGMSFSSSTGFKLPNLSVKSPDASFVIAERLVRYDRTQLRKFAPLVPDFIVEVLSPSDKLGELEAKVRDTWIANGVRLAWLVDVDTDRLWIYRADHSVELVTPLDRTITGEDVLPGFTFDLTLLQ